jgi:hypothetical protein
MLISTIIDRASETIGSTAEERAQQSGRTVREEYERQDEIIDWLEAISRDYGRRDVESCNNSRCQIWARQPRRAGVW